MTSDSVPFIHPLPFLSGAQAELHPVSPPAPVAHPPRHQRTAAGGRVLDHLVEADTPPVAGPR